MLPAGSQHAVTTSSVARNCCTYTSPLYAEAARISEFETVRKSVGVYLLASAQMPKHAASRTLDPTELPVAVRCSKFNARISALSISGICSGAAAWEGVC